MINDLSTLKVGERIAIARFGSWSTSSQGAYLVKNVNKVRVVVARETDGYERTFSTRTGVEKGSERYHSAFIETIAEMEERAAADQKSREFIMAWAAVEEAAKKRNSVDLLFAVDNLKKLLGKS